MKGSENNNREAKLKMKNAEINSAGSKSANNALVTWLMKEQSFIKPLAVGSRMMRLNVTEREPQNKQNVFEGFMRGLITGSSYWRCLQHDERVKDIKPAS
jgi:hypothetical protein